VGSPTGGAEKGDQKRTWFWWGMGPVYSITGTASHVFLGLHLSGLHQERLDVEEDIETVEGANTLRIHVHHIDMECISDIFNRAFDTKMIQQDVDQIVALILSRAGYERRRLEVGNDRMDHFFFVMHVLMEITSSRWTHNTYWCSRKWDTVCLYG